MKIQAQQNNIYYNSQTYISKPGVSYRGKMTIPTASTVEQNNGLMKKIVKFFSKNPKPVSTVSEPVKKKVATNREIFKMKTFFLLKFIPYSNLSRKLFNRLLDKYDFNSDSSQELYSFMQYTMNDYEEEEGSKANSLFMLEYIMRNARKSRVALLTGNVSNVAKLRISRPNDIENLKTYLESFLPVLPDEKVEKFYLDTIKYENTDILKLLIEDLNWQGLVPKQEEKSLGTYHKIKRIIRAGQKSKNPEVKKIFNDKDNLYNILQHVNKLFTCNKENIDLAHVIYDKSDNPQRDLDAIAAYLYGYEQYLLAPGKRPDDVQKISDELLATFPISNFERYALSNPTYGYSLVEQIDFRDKIRSINLRRASELRERHNYYKTPQDILNAMNDRVFTSEMITLEGIGKSLIESFAYIPYTEANKDTMSKITQKLSEIFEPKDTPEMAGIALIAARRGNAELLKFFNDKHIHYKHLLAETPEKNDSYLNQVISNAKINSLPLVNASLGPNACNNIINILENNPEIDINSRDEKGRGLIINAINNADIETLNYLATREDVDWNIKNSDGENILMQVIKKSSRPSLYFKKEFIRFLRNLPEDKFDINYINKNDKKLSSDGVNILKFDFLNVKLPYNVLSRFLERRFDIQEELFDEILQFPNLDTNIRVGSNKPILFALLNKSEKFKQVFLHPNTNRKLLFEDKDIKSGKTIVPKQIQDFINDTLNSEFINKIKDIYEQNGELTLSEIEAFVNYKDFRKLSNTKLNILGENIVHFLAEIQVPEQEVLKGYQSKYIQRIDEIIRKIAAPARKFISMPDDFGRTPLAKALEAENSIIAELLKKYGGE